MCAAKNTKDIFTTLFCFLLPGLLPAQLIAAPYQQGTDSNALVSIEAKGFDANVSQGGKSWTNSYPSGYSGTGALITSPNTGTNNNTGYVTNSPRLDYVVNFVKTGVHYVWIRGAGQTNSDDSLHVGLDGVALTSSNRISKFSSGLGWSNTQMGGTVAKINIATVGEHTLNIWMREDGTVFDKIVLTTNRTYTPANKGPSASVRGTTDNAPAPDPADTPDLTDTSYQQGTDSNALVSIEAKGFDSNLSQGGKSWTNSYPSGYSGTGALITSPNTGTNNNTGYVTNSPRLDYVVNFVKTGVHYVWIRGAGKTNSDDSLHVGLDGVALSSSNRISKFSSGLGWSNTQMGGTVAKINIATVGEHTLNIWMREDGTVFDKFVLTTNRTYTPANKGPSASVHSTTGSASYEPIAALSTNRLDFGNQDVGGISNPSSVRLTNSGTAPLYISGITTSAGFVQTNNCNDNLPVGENCVITVEFVPTSTGTTTGSLTISSNASSSGVVSLVGTGTDGSQPLSSLVPSGPIVINGKRDVVISGLHISNPNGRCVEVRNSSANVVIKNSEIGPCEDDGVYIESSENITIRDTYIHDTKGVGIRAVRAERIHVTSNQIERVASGVYAGKSKQVDINNNYILNVQGPYPRGQIVQFAYVEGPGNRINNNIGINEVGKSDTEDVINIYKSHGTPNDYIQVNGNILVGGGPSRSGGGILLGDKESSYAIADGNILVNPGATGIKISSGHHLILTNNKVFSDRKKFTNTGVPIGYQAKTQDMVCHSLEVSNNEITFWKGTEFLNDSKSEPFLSPYYKWSGCGTVTGWGTNKFDKPNDQPANLDESILPADLRSTL